jgi:cytochrome c-type biogenesis protein CcmH/NrfG
MDNDTQQATPVNAESTASVTTMDGSTVGLLVALGVLLVAVVGVSAYIWYGMQNTPASQTAIEPVADERAEPATPDTPQPGSELTEAEKMERLQSLQANPDNLSFEEKMNRLENLRTGQP